MAFAASGEKPENAIEIKSSQVHTVLANDSVAPAGSTVPLPQKRHVESNVNVDKDRHADKMPIARRRPTAADTINMLTRQLDETRTELAQTRAELDRMRIRYGNNMLSRKYKQSSVDKAIEEVNKVSEPSLVADSRQLRKLLEYYPAAYNEFLDYLTTFHNDPRKTNPAGLKNWYADAISGLRSLDVYKSVHGRGFVIVYLKEFVEAAEQRLVAGQRTTDKNIGFKDLINVLQVDRPKITSVSVSFDSVIPASDIDDKDIDAGLLN